MADYNFSTPESTRDAIRRECEVQGIGLPSQVAYVLATVEHETNRTWKPVREAYWKSEAWRKRNHRYWPFDGRGYVQMTWRRNYETYSKIIGIDLVAEPDLAMDPIHARFILVHGFVHGTFTGKKITDYIRPGKTDFRRARRCINGSDQATRIAVMAENWLIKLEKENENGQ